MPLTTAHTVSKTSKRDLVEKAWIEEGYVCIFRTFLTDKEGEITKILHIWQRQK